MMGGYHPFQGQGKLHSEHPDLDVSHNKGNQQMVVELPVAVWFFFVIDRCQQEISH